MFADIQKLKNSSVADRPTLWNMLKNAFSAEGKLYQLEIWIYTKERWASQIVTIWENM